MPPERWRLAWRRASWTRHPFGRIYDPSTAEDGVGRFLASLPDIHARHSAKPAGCGGPKTPGTSGPMSPASSATAALTGCSARTSRTIFVWGSSRSTTTYEAWVTRLRAACSRRANSVLRMLGSGSSYSLGVKGMHYWATPMAKDWKSGSVGAGTLGKNSRPLNEQATMCWPEVMARSGRPVRTTQKVGRQCRPALNPSFTEHLMGWPIGWSGYGPLAMESFRSWRQDHSSALRRYLDMVAAVSQE